ncbi:MAG TPA: c-type cytochrome, partial [Coxiellaceae bacterium]|nr:c-type cytochrome [Coxiellaceae bacterium]
EANHDSFRYLTPADQKAIAVYMKTTQSKQPPVVKIATGAEMGKSVYDSSCYACHNSGAAGAPVLGSSADWAPRLKTIGINALYKNAIVGIGAMPAMGNCTSCTDEQIKAAVDYIMQNSTGSNASKAPTSFGKPDVPLAPLTMAQGQQIYQENCAACHANGEGGAPKLGDKEAWSGRIQQGMPTLIEHSINGYHDMPANGACMDCNNAQIKAAVKYMVEESKEEGNYSLW